MATDKTSVVGVRMPVEHKAWLEDYAKQRGQTASQLLAGIVERSYNDAHKDKA